jgi:hypothetical protein
MRKLKTGTWKQRVFYGFIFLIGYIRQPNFVYENFWSRADFYESLPFAVPFWFYSIVCGVVFAFIVWCLIRFAKKHL